MESIRRSIVLPRVNLEALAGVATGSAFLWLLARGAIQPIVIYLLEIYFAF
jgi:hypothetical protein